MTLSLAISPLDRLKSLVTTLEFVCYCFHFVFGYHFVKKTMSVSLMHPNLRLIMCNIIIEYTLVGVGRIGDHFLASAPLLPTHVASVLCVFFRILQDTGILICVLTFLLITLERLMATILIRTYENKDGRVSIAIMLVSYFIAILAAVALSVYDWIATDEFNHRWTESCETSHTQPALLPTFLFLCGANYLFVSAVLVLLYRYNRKKKVCARDVPLSGRYQYAENVATLAVLVPSVLIWGVVCVVALMTEPFFYVAWVSDDRETQLFVNQIIYFLAALNSIVCPLAFVLKYRPLTNAFRYELQRFRLWKPCHTRSAPNSRGDEVQVAQRFPAHSIEEKRALAFEVTNEHFRQLQASWWK